MVKTIILVTVLLLVGCDDGPYIITQDRPDCSAHRKELAAFILECAKNANPLADEEGEDLVKQCERTGENVVCPVARFTVTYKCAGCSELYTDKAAP